MYYRRLKFRIIYLALNRGCFETVLIKNTPRTLGVKDQWCSNEVFARWVQDKPQWKLMGPNISFGK
jgi:hypothetical protein